MIVFLMVKIFMFTDKRSLVLVKPVTLKLDILYLFKKFLKKGSETAHAV
jgi:hypothetical protein